MRIAFLCIGVLGLLKFLLALNVSRNRRIHKISVGTGEFDSPVHRAVIAHANAAEFIPMFCVLMLTLEMAGSANWIVWVFGTTVAARCSHAIGILNYTMKKPNVFRFFGAAATYGTGLIMSGFLVYWVLSQQAHG